MICYNNPPRSAWDEPLARPKVRRDEEVHEKAASIISRVRTDGDAALFALTRDIDGVEIESLQVAPSEIGDADRLVSDDLKEAVSRAYHNIYKFHEAQRPGTIDVEIQPGVRCSQKAVPIGAVGLYIPGGTAPLFSTVLMLAVPASIAGCRRIALCTPPRKDGTVAPEILWAAKLCGITEIYRIGGAQAIAAMAIGTETISKVSKIFGPGNSYVTAAKQIVSISDAAVDMPAGPSEVMVMADSSADPSFVAADMLSQAEHGGDSQAILVTDSADIATAVEQETEKQLKELEREDFARASLRHSRIVVLDDMSDMIDFANAYAAEHLIISMRDADFVAGKIHNAASIFLGNYTPESAGDYASGTNHTLPTGGWARSFSGVNLDSFVKKITCQKITREGLEALAPTIEAMASAEGLTAHRNAVSIRLKKRN